MAVELAGNGHYPVHPTAELFLWLSPALGLQLDTVGLAPSMHSIQIDFVDAGGALVATSSPVNVMVNNQACVAGIGLPSLDGATAEPVCGTLQYTDVTHQVTMPIHVAHPAGFATYSFTLLKGVNTLTPPSTSGPVTGAPSVITGQASTLLGTCTIAGYGEYLYVAATMINGETRQSQYDASAAIAFVLAP